METQELEYVGTWEEITMHEPEFRGRQLRVIVLPAQESLQEERSSTLASPHRAPSARELLKLPIEERARILAEQAARAEVFYRTDPDLTDFEAFEEEDFCDETP